MREAPLVSVITPCHDGAAFLAETIETVGAQRYRPIEHIIVDDASEDATPEVLARYGSVVRAVRLPTRRGGSAARNVGATLARGELLMFLDADDLLSEDAIEALVRAARVTECGIAVCDCVRWCRTEGGTWRAQPRERPVPETDADLFDAFLTMSAWPPPCCVLWRRDAYALTGGWDESLARDQDTDILLRAYARGARLVRSDGGVGYYRSLPTTEMSVSGGVSLPRLHASIRVLDKLAAELEQRGLRERYAERLSRAYHRRALHGFRAGYRDAAQAALDKGRRLGNPLVSGHPATRCLERAVGLAHKESLIRGLARVGIASRSRRRMVSLAGDAAFAPPGPMVSVITACHNAAGFVAEMVESVAAQSYAPIEHIIVDDASDDGSWDIVQGMTRRFPHVRAHRLDARVGGSAARNRGFALARGELLMFLDADDRLGPETLSALAAAAEPSRVAICAWKRLRRSGRRWAQRLPDAPLPFDDEDHLRGWLLGAWVPPCACLWHRVDYERTGGWDESLCANQDGDLMLRALLRGTRLRRAPGGAAFYRAHDGASVSSSLRPEAFDSHVRVLVRTSDALEREGRAGEYRVALGIAWQRVAARWWRADPQRAKDCWERGLDLAGPQPVGRTWPGRVATKLVGLPRKERLAEILGRLGISTAARKRTAGRC